MNDMGKMGERDERTDYMQKFVHLGHPWAVVYIEVVAGTVRRPSRVCL